MSYYSRHIQIAKSINPLNYGLLFAYEFNGSTLATKGLQDGSGVNIIYSSDTQGQKAVFNGSSSRIYIDDSSDFDFSGDFTIEVDIIFSATGNQYFLGQSDTTGSDSSVSMWCGLNASNKIHWYVRIGSISYDIVGSNTLTAGVKYICLFERIGNVYKIYVNNSVEGTLTQSGTINNSLYKMCLGGVGEYIGGLFFNGQMCLFRGWNRSLTSSEKTQVYNLGNGYKFNVIPSIWGQDAITTQIVDPNSVGYSTFQSNSQRTVVNDFGIFQAHVHSTTGGTYTNQTWYLQRSKDDGRTWFTTYTGTCYDYDPVIETGADGTIYLIYTESATNAKLLIFDPSNYSVPTITTSIPISITSKFCMILDDVNDKIYYSNSRGYITILNKAGIITTPATQIVTTGITATIMYPSMTLDNSGNLYFAWTTQNNTGGIFYYNIRWAVSRDFGATWQMANGTPITLPIISDTGGEQVSVIGDLGVQNWLSGWIFANDMLHAVYWRESVAQKYVTINPTTAAITNSQNIVTSATPNLDGFFSRDKTGTLGSPKSLYFLTAKTNRTLLTLFETVDNGATWTNPADRYSAQLNLYYSITGYREQYNGYGYGVYTLLTSRAITYTENQGAYTYLSRLKLL